jgi:hypothetical protein
VTGTIFGSRLIEELPGQLTASGVPPQAVSQFSNAGTTALDNLVGVGGNLGDQILAAVPEAFRAAVQPIIPNIVAGIHSAFTIGVVSAFQIGVVTTILAAGTALFLKEIPLRTHMGEAPTPAAAPVGSEPVPRRWTESPTSD